MAESTNGKSHTLARAVAPLAPLALALAMTQAPSVQRAESPGLAEQDITPPDNVTAVVCDDNIADFQECHANYPTGCSAKAGYDPYLNYLKNLTPAEATGTNILNQSNFDDLNSKTPDGLSRTNHSDYGDQLKQLGEGTQFTVIGYLYYYQHTGAESSNCGLTGNAPNYDNVDYHIGIGFDPDLAAQAEAAKSKTSTALKKKLQQGSVIVEMTPHYRAQFHPADSQVPWTLDSLKPALGKKVKVTGQLLVDSEHNVSGQNCAVTSNPESSKCWRYSVWELHPITGFEICSDDACTQATELGGGSAASESGSSGGDAADTTFERSAPKRESAPRNPATRTTRPRPSAESKP